MLNDLQAQKIIASLVLAVILLANHQTVYSNPAKTSFCLKSFTIAQKFLRTELYFGTDKNDGTLVSDEDWNKFLAVEVTPKFPEGFTVLEGYGQFRDSGGKIVRENSKLLILLYPLKKRTSVNLKIESIRAAYKKLFQQESVLRMDFRQYVRISF